MRRVVIIALLLQGCSSAAGPSMRLGLLPLDGVGIKKARVARLQRTLSNQLAELSGVTLVSKKKVQPELKRCGKPPIPQRAWVDCAARVGREVDASHMVAGALGGLHKTLVLHLKLISVAKKAPIRTLEETYFNLPTSNDTAFNDLGRRLLNVSPTPWYKRWWFWTIVATSVTAVVLLSISLNDSVVLF